MQKKYVEVTAVFNEEGKIKPLSIHWNDGRKFEIDRITDVRRAASVRAGGVGVRYTCIIMGRSSYLFHEDNGKWFVEAR